MRKKLFIVDTMALVYRYHMALLKNPLINSNGINVSGVQGFFQAIIRIIIGEKPDYLAIATDAPEATLRAQSYPEYKSTRQKMPDDLVEQLPYLARFVECLNLPLLSLPGYEADDIVASLAKQNSDLDIFIASRDKDLLQLVNEHCFLWHQEGGKLSLRGIPQVHERYGIKPDYMIDLLALMGDKSDNIPGVPGIGEKTAANLINEHGHLDEIYAQLEAIKPAIQSKLTEHRGLAYLSRDLVRLYTDIDALPDLAELRSTPDILEGNQALIALFDELELRTLRDQLKQSQPQQSHEQSSYNLIKDYNQLSACVKQWQQQELIAVAMLATGADYFSESLAVLAFSNKPLQADYIVFGQDQLTDQQALSALKPLFENPALAKVGHDLKQLMHWLRHYGIGLEGQLYDSMIFSHMLNPQERKHDLDHIILRELNITTTTLAEEQKSKSATKNPLLLEQGLAQAEQADLGWRLYEQLKLRIKNSKQLQPYQDIEMPLIGVLARLEEAGINFDRKSATALAEDVQSQLNALEAEIYQQAGEEFNINSVLSLQNILYGKHQLHERYKIRPRKIKTGLGFSTDEEELNKLGKHHPLPRKILEYRELFKLKSTYLDRLGSYVNSVTGRIHTSLQQSVAATGRLSSDNPNLQNIPIRSAAGRKIRRLFIPRDADHVLVSADYSQIELRVVAHYSAEDAFIKAFSDDDDIHAITGGHIFSSTQISPEQRAVAKEVNFGLIYRMGADKLAQVTDCSKDDAKQFIARYFESYPSIARMQEELVLKARHDGYAETLFGRRRILEYINSSNAFAMRRAEGMAINTPIQGTAAEIIKIAMLKVEQQLIRQKLASRLILSIHDELLFDVPRTEIEALTAVVVAEMEGAVELAVPLRVNIAHGPDWLAAH